MHICIALFKIQILVHGVPVSYCNSIDREKKSTCYFPLTFISVCLCREEMFCSIRMSYTTYELKIDTLYWLHSDVHVTYWTNIVIMLLPFRTSFRHLYGKNSNFNVYFWWNNSCRYGLPKAWKILDLVFIPSWRKLSCRWFFKIGAIWWRLFFSLLGDSTWYIMIYKNQIKLDINCCLIS